MYYIIYRAEKQKYIHSRAYIIFRTDEALLNFAKFASNKTLQITDHKGIVMGSTVVEVEYAPNQKVRHTACSEPECNYSMDDVYLEFLESLRVAEAADKEEKKPLAISKEQEPTAPRTRTIVETPLVKQLMDKKYGLPKMVKKNTRMEVVSFPVKPAQDAARSARQKPARNKVTEKTRLFTAAVNTAVSDAKPANNANTSTTEADQQLSTSQPERKGKRGITVWTPKT